MNIKTLLTDEEIKEAIKPHILHDRFGIGKTITKAQDAKTKRVIVEWLREHNNCPVIHEGRAFVLMLKDWQEFKKWAE